MNLWGYLIVGLTGLFTWLLNSLPLAQTNPLFTETPGVVATIIVAPYFWVSPVFDLTFMGVGLGLFLLLELVRAIIAIVRWIYSLIPTAA